MNGHVGKLAPWYPWIQRLAGVKSLLLPNRKVVVRERIKNGRAEEYIHSSRVRGRATNPKLVADLS